MCVSVCIVFFFKQKTAYEMRISDWSSDVCSSDLGARERRPNHGAAAHRVRHQGGGEHRRRQLRGAGQGLSRPHLPPRSRLPPLPHFRNPILSWPPAPPPITSCYRPLGRRRAASRDRKSTRLNSSQLCDYRMPSSALKKKKYKTDHI